MRISCEAKQPLNQDELQQFTDMNVTAPLKNWPVAAR